MRLFVRNLQTHLLVSGLLSLLTVLSAMAQEQPPTHARTFLSGKVSHVGDKTPLPTFEVLPQQPGVVGLDLLIHPAAYPVVKGVFEGTPAFEQGLMPGDQILSVNGETTLGKSRQQVDWQIPDAPGTPVTFTVHRSGQTYRVQLVVAGISHLPSSIRQIFSPSTR